MVKKKLKDFITLQWLFKLNNFGDGVYGLIDNYPICSLFYIFKMHLIRTLVLLGKKINALKWF